MPTTHTEGRPGFQGSETSGARISLYTRSGDPVVLVPPMTLTMAGRRAADPQPALVGASTSKTMGQPSGTFEFQVKPGRVVDSLFRHVVDDDWVDVEFFRHDRSWHVMRGLVDNVSRKTVVSGTGAAQEVWSISGGDFGKVWELTPVWFSPYANDLVSESVANRVFKARPEVLGDPGTVVSAFFRLFLEEISERAGPNWAMPDGMPGVEAGSFINSVVFRTSNPYFQNIPPRKAFNPGFMAPQGTLWSLAQQYSDPMFCELYVDLLPGGDPFSTDIGAGSPLPVGDVDMTVVLRDRPFPIVDSEVEDTGYVSRWLSLPVHTVARQETRGSELSRSGAERFNAFYVANLLHTETLGPAALEVIAPLVNRGDIEAHGFRRMDVQSNQAPDESDLDYARLASLQRRMVKDWYCLNPYMVSGSIPLARGRPDIKIGSRLRVPAATNRGGQVVVREENYYVEQVSHSWALRPGIRTNLGVTRGWIGDDDEYLDKLRDVSARFVHPDIG